MRRVSALLLLVALAFPYAKAPLCQAGSHEHPEEMGAHHQHGSDRHHDSSALASLESTLDCHELMQCQVAVDVVRARATLASAVALAPAADRWLSANHPERESRAPEPPPPQLT